MLDPPINRGFSDLIKLMNLLGTAELDGDTIQYDNGESIWLVSYLAQYDWDNPAPHSTEDSFKIGKVVKEYNITWQEIEEEARLMNG